MHAHKMKYAYLLFISTSVLADNGTDKIVCDGIIFNDVYFDREQIITGLGRPYNLVLHKFSGYLFFSHTVESVTHVDFGIMTCHIEKKKCFEVKGIPGGYAVAYDPGNDDIYLGGHDGIYKYNFLTRTAEFFAEEDKSVWEIFVKRNFYYIEYPNQKLHVYQDDKFVPVAEAVNIEIDHFFVSKQVEIYFSNKTALFKVEREGKEPMVLDDSVVVRQIVEDNYGDVYFCGNDGIYLEVRPYHKIKKVAHIEHSFGMTFDDKDFVIYSDRTTIYRMKPSEHTNLCFQLLTSGNTKDEFNEEKFRN